MTECDLRDLGVVTYENGMRMQERLVEARQKDEIPDQLLLLEHPPVITLGRSGNLGHLTASDSDLRIRGVRFYETTRGGDITYHGPGQVVGYPILHLGEGSRDVRRYVTNVEEVLIRTAADYGIVATRDPQNRGVWVEHEKLGAIGVRIARWVTSHGFAFNVSPDLEHFSLIVPCGIQGRGVTSLERLLGRAVDANEVRQRIAGHFSEVFERRLTPRTADLTIISVLPVDGDRVLLLRRKPEHGAFWQPVTGKIEPGESPIEAATRETAEETGASVRVEDLELTQSFLIEGTWAARYGREWIFTDEIDFAAHIDSGSTIRISPEEHDDFGWFTFEEAYERVHWSDDREMLERVQRRVTGS